MSVVKTTNVLSVWLDSSNAFSSSPTAQTPGSPFVVHYPHKNSLYASMGHRWPLRVNLLHGAPDAIARRELTGKQSFTFADQILERFRV